MKFNYHKPTELSFEAESLDKMLVPYKLAMEMYEKNMAENDELAEGISQYDRYLNDKTLKANKLSNDTKDLIRKGADYIGTDYYLLNRAPLLRAKRTYQQNSNVLKGGVEKMQSFLEHEQKQNDADGTRKHSYIDKDGNLVEDPNVDNFLYDDGLTTYAMSGEAVRKAGQANASAISGRVADAFASAGWNMQFDPRTGIPVFVNYDKSKTVSGVNVAATLAQIQGLDPEGRQRVIAQHPELKGFFDNPDLVNALADIQQDENYTMLRDVDKQYIDNKYWEGVLQGLGPYKITKDEKVTGNPHWTQYDEANKAPRSGGSGGYDVIEPDSPVFEYLYSTLGEDDHWNKYGKDFARLGMKFDKNDPESATLQRNIAIGAGFDRSGNQVWDAKGGENDDLSVTNSRDEIVNNAEALAAGVKNYVTLYDKDNNDRVMSEDKFVEKNMDNMMAILDEDYQAAMSLPSSKFSQYFGEKTDAYHRKKLLPFNRSYNMNDPKQKEEAKIQAETYLREMHRGLIDNIEHAIGGKVTEETTMESLNDKLRQNMLDAGAASYRMMGLNMSEKDKKDLGDKIVAHSGNNSDGEVTVKLIKNAERDKAKNGVHFKTEDYTLDDNDIKAIGGGNLVNVALPPDPNDGVVVEWMNGTQKKTAIVKPKNLPIAYEGTKDTPGIKAVIEQRNAIEKKRKDAQSKLEAYAAVAQTRPLTESEMEAVKKYQAVIVQYQEDIKRSNKAIKDLMTTLFGGRTESVTAKANPNNPFEQ